VLYRLCRGENTHGSWDLGCETGDFIRALHDGHVNDALPGFVGVNDTRFILLLLGSWVGRCWVRVLLLDHLKVLISFPER